MPTVFPGATDPTHHISLSDGTNTYGFVFYGGPRSLQEIPLSPPAARFAVEQRNWIGGRGIILVPGLFLFAGLGLAFVGVDR